MSDQIYCKYSTMYCTGATCPTYDAEHEVCLEQEFYRLGVKAFNKILGGPLSDFVKPEPPKGKARDPITAMSEAGLDLSLVDIDGKTVKPKAFLGDLWGGFNEALKTAGYNWKSAGKDSHWTTDPVEKAPKQGAPKADDDVWSRNKKNTGDWAFSDKTGDLSYEISEAGGKLTKGDYFYSLYGETNADTGLPKFVGRYPARKK